MVSKARYNQITYDKIPSWTFGFKKQKPILCSLTHFRAIGVKILLNISNWKSHLLAQYSGHTHTTPVPFDLSDPP